MCRKKLSTVITIGGLATFLVSNHAISWEFNVKGAWSWELEMVSQTGRNGFFGPYDGAADSGAGLFPATVGAYAPYNLWVGQLGYRIVSGSDSSWYTQYITTFMRLRMNKALEVRGSYYVGSWNPPNSAATGSLVTSEYFNQTFPRIQQSFSPGYWNTLWLSAEVPWGIVTFGKRPSTWGIGLGWNGEFTRTAEHLALSAPYGPFRIQISFYPSRNSSNPETTGDASDYYNPNYDKNNKRLWDITVPHVTYRCGPFDFGVRATFITTHRGGEGFVEAPGTRITGHTYRDRYDFYGGVYLKYYTGTVFFNSEMDRFHRTDRNRHLTAGGAPAAGVRDTYFEHYRVGSELAILSGPLRLALLYAWSSGGDRRGNITTAVKQIDRNGIIRKDTFANTGLFKPYSYLMVYSYGLGSFVDGTTRYGYGEDASVYGARLDYAVPANLNMYGTFFWADRASKSGFGWGCILPDPSVVDGNVIWGARQGPMSSGNWNNGQGLPGAPNIPDTNLGWEVDAGANWKLLEGLTLNTTFAYWQPGNWFKFACVDKTVPNWGGLTPATRNAGNNWGINPDRAIDPVWAMRIVLNGEF